MSYTNQAGGDRSIRLPNTRGRQVAGSRLSLTDEAGDCRIQRSRPLPDWHAQGHGGNSWPQVIQHQPIQACALSSSSAIPAFTCHMKMVQQQHRLQNVLANQQIISQLSCSKTVASIMCSYTWCLPAMMELIVPLPSQPRTLTPTILASLATPTVLPAATEATCVPCPSQSEAFQSLFPSAKSHLQRL